MCIRDRIERGQNDPAIIMWSLGNEMWEGTSGYNNSYKTAQDNLVKWAEAIDTTRPVTTGDNKLKGNEAGAITPVSYTHLDVYKRQQW